ncbi:hypothetical protein WJX74_004302 [Apatococcus lobatus]|uniref:N-acetyltransferase domain-containing protein n=1 Tax=Apatococcus lobatus TaxID=904363 RepID=A0AAW1RQ60_9CHLO
MANTSEKSLQGFMRKKQQATQEAHAQRAEQEVERLRAELNQVSGGSIVRQTYKKIARSLTSRTGRSRRFMCLVAEESGGIVGTVTLTSATPEALLPAPFPTSKPQRMYLSSLAVADTHRRQGIASALLKSCESLGKRWQQDTLWLHVDCSNPAAQSLYARALYDTIGQDPFWFGPFRRLLLRKMLLQPPSKISGKTSAARSIGGSKRLSDGVFVWDKRE